LQAEYIGRTSQRVALGLYNAIKERRTVCTELQRDDGGAQLFFGVALRRELNWRGSPPSLSYRDSKIATKGKTGGLRDF